jgi:hypothetical protein
VDKVDFCIPKLLEDADGQPIAKQLANPPTPPLLHNIEILLHWLSLSQQPRFHVDQSPEVISSTLFKIMHSDINPDLKNYAQYREDFGDCFTLLKPSFESNISVNSPEIEAVATALQANKDLYLYLIERCHAIAGKRLFFTTEERRLGTGPSDTQLGDVVVLLAGFSTPIVLRESGPQTYEVVGVAYVEGIMQGEAWTENEQSLRELTLI